LIMIAIYTANLAAILGTQSTVSDPITEWSDLNKLKPSQIGTWDHYSERLKKVSNLSTTPYPWIGGEPKDMLDGLKRKKYDVLILDEPVLRYWATQNCDYSMVGVAGGLWLNLGVMFPSDADLSLVRSYTYGKAKTIHDGVSLRLKEKYMPESEVCVTIPSAELGLSDLMGVWVCFATAMSVALILGACVSASLRTEGEELPTQRNDATMAVNTASATADKIDQKPQTKRKLRGPRRGMRVPVTRNVEGDSPQDAESSLEDTPTTGEASTQTYHEHFRELMATPVPGNRSEEKSVPPCWGSPVTPGVDPQSVVYWLCG